MVTRGSLYRAFGAWLRRWSFDSLRHRPAHVHHVRRIAYVLWRYPTLSETFIRREVQSLRQAGVALHVFALEPDVPPAPDDVAAPAGRVIYFGPQSQRVGRSRLLFYFVRRPWTVARVVLLVIRHHAGSSARWWRDRETLYLAAQLAAALDAEGITHVHAPWTDSYALMCLVASRMLGISFSTQARASEIHRTRQHALVADRVRFADFVITNSQYNVPHLVRCLADYRVPPIHVVYNGLPLSRFVPVSGRTRSDGPFRVLAIGRLVEPKGFRYLLCACAELRRRGLSFTVDIVGGPMEPADTVTWLDLRMLHTSLALEGTVHFWGAQPFNVVMKCLSAADLFVLPCVSGADGSHDITPNSLIEAMAMALPVISTTSGAIPEIVDHGVNGVLVPPCDVAALADAIEQLAADPARCRALGEAARQKVHDRFDIDRNVAARVALFSRSER